MKKHLISTFGVALAIAAPSLSFAADITLNTTQSDGHSGVYIDTVHPSGSASIYNNSAPGQYGYAAVDLANGTLHAFAGDYGYGGFSGSSAFYAEALTFNAPASLPTYSVGFTFTYHGALTPGDGIGMLPGYASLVARGKISMEGHDDGTFQAVVGNNPLVGPGINIAAKDEDGNPIPNGLTSSGFSDISYTLDPDGEVTFFGQYDGLVGGMSQTLVLSDSIGLLTSNGGVADYAHTATLSLTLPDGVTFTPADSIFLSSPAPEPATWAMMLLGFGGLGAISRRRRTVSAAA